MPKMPTPLPVTVSEGVSEETDVGMCDGDEPDELCNQADIHMHDSYTPSVGPNGRIHIHVCSTRCGYHVVTMDDAICCVWVWAYTSAAHHGLHTCSATYIYIYIYKNISTCVLWDLQFAERDFIQKQARRVTIITNLH